MANSIAIEALYAERSSLQTLIAILPPDDILGRMSLEFRLKSVETQIQRIKESFEGSAEAVLFFGGDSVSGSYGINVDLASDALKNYQSLVSIVHASRTQKNRVAENGPVPDVGTSTLQLVATPRGSFGFVLKERSDQLLMTESSLHESVEVANELIAASALESEDEFESVVDAVHPRVLKELNSFLVTLDKYRASIRLVSSRTRVDISKLQIKLASSRTDNIEVDENEVHKNGVFLGARKHSRDFNFFPDNEQPISGKLGNEIEDKTVSLMNTEYQDRRCKAILLRKETKRKESGRTTVRWTLKDIFLEDVIPK